MEAACSSEILIFAYNHSVTTLKITIFTLTRLKTSRLSIFLLSKLPFRGLKMQTKIPIKKESKSNVC
jgi:hypothetical protein